MMVTDRCMKQHFRWIYDLPFELHTRMTRTNHAFVTSSCIPPHILGSVLRSIQSWRGQAKWPVTGIQACLLSSTTTNENPEARNILSFASYISPMLLNPVICSVHSIRYYCTVIRLRWSSRQYTDNTTWSLLWFWSREEGEVEWNQK